MTNKPVEPHKIYRCKFCKVQVISATNTRPILGVMHGKHCPRRLKI